MYESRFVVVRVRGIPIGVSWSWLLVAGFLTWWLATQLFPQQYPGLATGTYLAMAAASALMFFVSIVLHELGHAFRALREGVKIEGITLWLLGGVARFLGMFPSAGAELRIAVAGPLVSVALAVAFWLLGALGHPLGMAVPLRGVLEYLAAINVLVVVFNLVPALPLDGGRILRSLLWRRRGDFASATRTAAVLGQGFGILLGASGIYAISQRQMATGVWLALIGAFIVNAARAEASYGVVDGTLGRARVDSVMTPNPLVVSPGTTIDDLLVRAAALASPLPAYPVADQGELVGLISLRRVGSIPPEDRASRTVAEAMTPRERVTVLSPDTPMRQALGAIQASDEPAVVTEGGRIAGLVSVLDVARALKAHLGSLGAAGRRRRRSYRKLLGGVAGLAAVVVLGVVWHPPVYVLSPGPATDVSHDMTITGVPVRTPTVPYLLTTVRADQHTALADVVEMFRPHRAMVTTADVGSIAFQDLMFDESRVLAAAAAARARGIAVTLTGAGVQVIGVTAGSPAVGTLKPGDLITAIDGTPARTEFELEDAVRSRPAGTRFGLSVVRNGKTVAVSAASGEGKGGPVLGIVPVTSKIDVAAPFRITFVPRDIGGPSAGLAYALAIADALSPAGPRALAVVAATGTIDLTGTVGDVGGVDLKGFGARRQGASLFIVPADELAAARGTVPDVKGVTSLSQALALLSGAA
ncbi:MAG TPA: site-2 protease family protein [Actinomycetota bacterium]|nr:site-2 protease family protein [Actinomycetota bacterium]